MTPDRFTTRMANTYNVPASELTGAKSLIRWCPGCRHDREIELPEHPAGLGTCTVCGFHADLYDTPRAERREYLAQYTTTRKGK